VTPRNRTAAIGADQQAIEGVRKDLQAMPTLYLARQIFTPASLEQRIQARIDAANAITVAKAAWLKAVADYDALDGETSLILRDLKRLVVGAFGDDSPKLADFGFTAKKVTTLTEEQKAQAVAKRAATRAARGTRGPKAKLSVTGSAPSTSSTTK
jgi:hypothetical protein